MAHGNHGQQAPLLWAHDEAEHQGKRVWQRKAIRLIADRKQRRGWGQDIVIKVTAPSTHSLQLGSTSYSFYCLPIIHSDYNLSMD